MLGATEVGSSMGKGTFQIPRRHRTGLDDKVFEQADIVGVRNLDGEHLVRFVIENPAEGHGWSQVPLPTSEFLNLLFDFAKN